MKSFRPDVRQRWAAGPPAILLACLLPAAAAAQGWGESYRLTNGLQVVLTPEPQLPTLAVLVRYHVGARHEPPGRSGLSHLLEHLRFRIPDPRAHPTVAPTSYAPVSSN